MVLVTLPLKVGGYRKEAETRSRGRWIGHRLAGMTQPVLRTDRLTLRPLTAEHVEHLVELDSEPEVLRYIAKAGSDP